jgi:hypothetical protein
LLFSSQLMYSIYTQKYFEVIIHTTDSGFLTYGADLKLLFPGKSNTPSGVIKAWQFVL